MLAYTRLYTHVSIHSAQGNCAVTRLTKAVAATLPYIRTFDMPKRRVLAEMCSFSIERRISVCRRVDHDAVKHTDMHVFVIVTLYLLHVELHLGRPLSLTSPRPTKTSTPLENAHASHVDSAAAADPLSIS